MAKVLGNLCILRKTPFWLQRYGYVYAQRCMCVCQPCCHKRLFQIRDLFQMLSVLLAAACSIVPPSNCALRIGV